MWIKRAGDPEKKHRCDLPMRLVDRYGQNRPQWPVPDGAVGGIWVCDDCENVWIIAPRGDWGVWVEANWWTARKARKMLRSS